MEESESRAFAEAVVTTHSHNSPSGMCLLSSGYGPLGWTQNRVWRAVFTNDECPPLVVKIGDGPMACFVVKEIDVLSGVLPGSHPNLPVVYSVSRAPTPYILMECLAPVPLYADLKDTPPGLARELALILPSILLPSKPDRIGVDIPNMMGAAVPDTKGIGIPWALSCGNLSLRNVGRRSDGTLVVFDWDAARRAPIGADFKFFSGHPDFVGIMEAFHGRCLELGANMPPAEVWLQRLREIWHDEDREMGRHKPSGPYAAEHRSTIALEQ